MNRELVYHIFSYTTALVSCTLNSLLIYILVAAPIRHVGPYRWLLMAFAFVDVCISLMHIVTAPEAYMTEFGLFVVPTRFVDLSTELGVWSMVVWLFIYYQTFILLAFHYVYRYVLLCSPNWLAWIQRHHPWRIWVTVAFVVDLLSAGSVAALAVLYLGPSDESRRAYAPVIKRAYGIDLNAHNKPGFFATTFWIPEANGEQVWQSHTGFALFCIGVQVAASIAIIVYCIARIACATGDTNLESKTRQMQRQLFRTLVWQTIIPTFTSYAPVGFVMVFPLLSPIPLGGWGTVALSSMQLLPMIDPLLIFYFVPIFRTALPKFARQLAPFKTSTSDGQNAPNVVAPIASTLVLQIEPSSNLVQT